MSDVDSYNSPTNSDIESGDEDEMILPTIQQIPSLKHSQSSMRAAPIKITTDSGTDTDMTDDDDDDIGEDLDEEKEKLDPDIDEDFEMPSSLKSSGIKKPAFLGEEEEEEEEEEDDEDDDENYLKKFNKQVNHDHISEFHPECISHNYDEISAVSAVVRDEDGSIVDDFHKTIPFLTKFERTRILGQRAKQINHGATPFIRVPVGIIEGHVIAEMELREKKIPFIIKRPLNGGGCEYWKVSDLEDINF